MWLLFFRTWKVLKVGQGRRKGGRFESKGQVWRRKGGREGVMSSHEPLPCEEIFHKLCMWDYFFSAFIIFSPLLALLGLFLLFSFYSTSSASSPWSPSISKAAYLLAELNFWKKNGKKEQNKINTVSFGCCANTACARKNFFQGSLIIIIKKSNVQQHWGKWF